MNEMSIMSARGLSLGYGTRVLVSDVCFSLASGELLSVIGHNGAGKSSLVRLLLGLLPPIEGAVDWHKGQRPKNIAYLGQRQDLDRSFPMKSYDLVASGGWSLSALGLGGMDAGVLHRRSMAAIRRVGLRDAMSLPLHALSGGQLQRALFARAMVQDADLLILDEPFAGVDQKTESDLLALILEWTQNGKAVVLVSHDLSSVLNHATNALLLGDGRARFGAPCEVLTSENLIDQGYMTASQAEWLSGMYRETVAHV